jgi:hypothetical protein
MISPTPELPFDPAADRRRRASPAAPALGELVVESSWRPTDRPPVAVPGWLVAHGYAPERRRAAPASRA